MHADRPAVRRAAWLHRLRNVDRLGDGVVRCSAYAESTEPMMRSTPVHTLTLLTLVGAALCALWLAAAEPSIGDPLPVSSATGR
jgi:hypothetical protein